MRIVIITQNDPFYLKKNLEYLVTIIPKNCEIVGCIVDDVSQFGRKKSFIFKSIRTLQIFGVKFFTYYAIRFIKAKFENNSIRKFLAENKIEEIKLDKPINSDESIKKIKSFNPDLLVSILGGQIFKKKLINLCENGCINLHTSLLPKYRGMMPTFWVLKNNEKSTGVSVFFVDEGIDSGPIIVQEKFNIGNRTQAELIKFSKKKGMEAIAKAINLINEKKYKLMPNSEKDKSYYSFPTRKDVIDFKKLNKKFY